MPAQAVLRDVDAIKRIVTKLQRIILRKFNDDICWVNVAGNIKPSGL